MAKLINGIRPGLWKISEKLFSMGTWHGICYFNELKKKEKLKGRIGKKKKTRKKKFDE